MRAATRLEELGVSGLGSVDEPAFSGLAERHRRELHVHCYRMLGSFQDAEDTVQETFLRAWRWRETFEGRSTFRAWLYRIATNACLDLLAKCRPEPATGGECGGCSPTRTGCSTSTGVNRQPAVAFYLWREREGGYLPLTIDVLRVTGGAIAEIVTFHADRFPRLGLPERLPGDGTASGCISSPRR